MSQVEKVSQYYESSNAYIYPSSNASDGGENNSEKNLRTITDKFTSRSFVVKRAGSDNYFRLSLDDKGTTLRISGGECVIQGYFLSLGDLEINVENLGLGKHLVVIQILKDGSGLVRGDGRVFINGSESDLYCKGTAVHVISEDKYYKEIDPSSALVLGEYYPGTGRQPSESTNRYSFLDSESIVASNGTSIEDWINYVISHLYKLERYDENEDIVTRLILDLHGKVHITGAGESSTVLVDSDIAPSENSTDLGTIAEVPAEDTQNGTSDKLARADHRHDGRYILNELACKVSTVLQKIGTGLHVFGNLKVGDKVAVTASDGSVSAASGNFTVDKSGNVKGEEIKGTLLKSTGSVEMAVNGSLKRGDSTVIGSDGKVYGAVWNDYAELYRKEDPSKVYEPGTVISKVKGRDTYDASTHSTCHLVVGVVSDSYGHLLGGDEGASVEENLKNYVPVALCGRVYVNVVSGVKIDEGDLLCASMAPGRATVSGGQQTGTIIGKALESSDGTKSKVLIQVMLK